MPILPEGLSLQATGSRGRGVVAARPFKPGDLIATFADPSIAIPDSPSLDRTCNYCLSISTPSSPSDAPIATTSAPTKRLRACTGCKTVSYCSTTCQKSDWDLVHGNKRGECKVFKRVRASGHDFLPTPVRALVQVFLRPEMRDAVIGTGAEMEGHEDRFRRDQPGIWADMELQARAALHYAGMESTPKNVAEAVEVLCKLQVNSFNRLDGDTGQTGLFLNPSLAMINHSCIPSAFVQSVGRKAVLHAYREIKRGEEVEISYIECTLHRSHRQGALKKQYHFTCACLRCEEDLDSYQVCRTAPHLELNNFSLVSDLHRLREPPVKQFLSSSKALLRGVEDIYPTCSASLDVADATLKMKQLRQQWRACEQLRKAGLYAIDPLNLVLFDASIYFGEQLNYAYALAISCFLALNCEPYRNPMPFAPPRVKGVMMVAKVLANTAPADLAHDLSIRGSPLATKISQATGKIDQATTCQVLLELVVHYGPIAHSDEWQVYRDAKDLLKDLESLPGRETERTLIKAFVENPMGPTEMQFFESTVLKPIQSLADFALEVMATELG